MRSNDQDAADRYAEVTDGCRYLIPPGSHIVRQARRVKPDPEDSWLAQLDYKEFATLGDEAVRLWTEEAPRNSARRSNKQ